MYYVKERGRSDFRFYQRKMNIGLLSRMKIDHAMRLALEHQNSNCTINRCLISIVNKCSELGADSMERQGELGDISPRSSFPSPNKPD